MSSEHPFVKAWIDVGQRSRLSGMLNSTAIVGRATVVRPLSSVLIAVISVTEAMIAVVRDFDVMVVMVSVCSKL